MYNNIEKNILSMVDGLFNLTDEQHTEVLKAYKDSLDNIRTQLAKFYAKYSVDNKLPYSEVLKYNRLASLEQQIKEEIKNLNGFEVQQVNLILDDIYKQSYYQTVYTLESSLKTAIDWSLLNPKLVKEAISFNWSGVPFSERIWSNHDDLVKSIRTNLTRGIIEGESIDKMAKRIQKAFDTSAYNSQRLVRTEASRVINSGQDKSYKESGVVDKVQWLATLDGRTSQICRSRDGKQWDINKPHPSPPAHPNCRSTLVPIIDGWTPSKRKDNQTKKIIEYKNYNEWYQVNVEK